jgi:hypothetical protein
MGSLHLAYISSLLVTGLCRHWCRLELVGCACLVNLVEPWGKSTSLSLIRWIARETKSFCDAIRLVKSRKSKPSISFSFPHVIGTLSSIWWRVNSLGVLTSLGVLPRCLLGGFLTGWTWRTGWVPYLAGYKI